MKVEIKLTADHIFYLQSKLQVVSVCTAAQFVCLDRQRKNEYSLLLDCYDKISAKATTIGRKPAIFDKSKKYTMSLKYHEASILNTLCCGLKDMKQTDSYLANAIFLLIDKKL